LPTDETKDPAVAGSSKPFWSRAPVWCCEIAGFLAAAEAPADGSVLVVEHGALVKRGAADGREIWRLPQVTRWTVDQFQPGFEVGDSMARVKPQPSAVDGDRFFRWNEGFLEARRLEDGGLLWRAGFSVAVGVSEPERRRLTGLPLVFAGEGLVLGVEPVSGRVQAWDAKDGAPRWQRTDAGEMGDAALAGAEARALVPGNTGACHRPGFLFVYGRVPYLLDTRANRVLWVHEPTAPLVLPVLLQAGGMDGGELVAPVAWQREAPVRDVVSAWRGESTADWWRAAGAGPVDGAGPLGWWWETGRQAPLSAVFLGDRLLLRAGGAFRNVSFGGDLPLLATREPAAPPGVMLSDPVWFMRWKDEFTGAANGIVRRMPWMPGADLLGQAMPSAMVVTPSRLLVAGPAGRWLGAFAPVSENSTTSTPP
jgi:hypothetical protein